MPVNIVLIHIWRPVKKLVGQEKILQGTSEFLELSKGKTVRKQSVEKSLQSNCFAFMLFSSKDICSCLSSYLPIGIGRNGILQWRDNVD